MHVYVSYTWKYHSETLYSYLMQTKISFKKNGEQEGKTGPVWRLAPVGGGGYKERCRRVNMVEYYALMYENGKMRSVETIPGMGDGDKGEWWRG
jgi:hypothetical protein